MCQFCELWFTRPWVLKKHLEKCKVKNKLYDENKVKFECRVCKMTFKMKSYLRNHEECHRDITDKPYSCFYIDCDKVFMNRDAANGCERMHEELFKCDICGICRRGKTELERHKAGHNQLRFIYQCEECDVGSFVQEKSLKKHMMKVHSGPNPGIKCDICRRPLASKESLVHHMKRNHKSIFHRCTDCPKLFRLQSALESHVDKIHNAKESPWGCSECGENLKGAHGLQSHKKAHTGAKDFQCPECPSKFRRKWSMVCHLRIHKGEYPNSCDLCERKFRNGSGLNKHKQTTHEKVEKVKYPCDYCEFKSKSKNYLKLHIRTHTGERPHKCPVCPLAFSRLFVVKEHCKKLHSFSKEDLEKAGFYRSKLIKYIV